MTAPAPVHPAPRSIVALLLAGALAAALAACGEPPTEIQLAEGEPIALAAMAVEVGPRPSSDTLTEARAFVQADGGGAFLYDALAAPQDDPAMGLTVGGRRVLDGWSWWLDADSVALGGADRHRGVARPDFAVRAYRARDTTDFVGRLLNRVRGGALPSIVERVALLDADGAADTTGAAPAALSLFVPDSIGTVRWRPAVSASAGADSARTVDGALVFVAARGAGGPVWAAARSSRGEASVADLEAAPEAGRDAANVPGELTLQTPGDLVVATAATPAEAARRAQAALDAVGARLAARSARLAAFVDAVPLDTDSESFDRAFRWAAVHLDALTARDSASVAVRPGLPGADPQPGRSTIEAVPALLALGRWEDARALVRTFGRAQRFDRRADLLGRAPDVVLPGGEARFETADGTPRFLAAAGDVVRTTGDRGLVTGPDDFWFKSVFAMRGLYEPDERNGDATDARGFLTTRDGRGAWMDGDPERGGARRQGAPVEAQAALARALGTLDDFARIMGVSGRANARWYADTAAVLQRDALAAFAADGVVYGEVGRDGRGAAPGSPAALDALDGLGLAPEERARYARALADRLAYRYGVATRAQTDSAFHPWLRAPGLYREEAARYGGSVATWLAGPLARTMAQTGGVAPAWALTETQAEILLERGVVGALPEMLDGHPRGDRDLPGVGGAPVEAWALASFVRTAMEGFVGAGWPAADTLALAPRLPDALGEVTATLRLGGGRVTVDLDQDGDRLRATVTPSGALPATAALRLRGAAAELTVPLVVARGDTAAVARAAFEVEIDGAEATLDGQPTADGVRAVAPLVGLWDGFAFQAPDVQEEYPVTRVVESRRALSGADILRANPGARVIASQVDPDGDDWGSTNTFTYPGDVPEGVLDATYLEVSRDDSTTYVRMEFTALADAGAPTVVAVAFDTEPGGERRVGREAQFDFPSGEGYEFVAWVGDGVRIEDARGRSMGELAPGQGSAMDPATGTLEFAVPEHVMPALSRGDKVYALVGARAPDGVGAFRRVERRASETRGGGKVSEGAPNVYDVVVGTVTR